MPVKLIVRGICALRPGAKGLSENIRVKSVVGRYLEHSRIFCFRNADDPEVFIGSGDWMMRNLRERVEVIAPIRDGGVRDRLMNIMAVYWADNTSTRWMTHDGLYTRAAPKPGTTAVNAQEWFMSAAASEQTSPPGGLWD